MSKTRSRVLTILAFCFLGASVLACEERGPSVIGADGAAIQSVLAEVKAGLADVQTKLANNQLPPLKEVKLSLQTVATKKVGLTLKLWVLTLGHTVEKDRTQQIEISLTPPSPGNAVPIGTETLTEDLENAIISAAEGVQQASEGKIPLKFSGLSVQIGFTVKADTNGGANVQITPVTLEFSGDLAKTAIHQLTVTFGSGSKSSGNAVSSPR